MSLTQEQRESMLKTLATRVACTICHHEAGVERHHGNHRLDMHHAPVLGPVPLRCKYGYSFEWWHARDAVSWYSRFVYPDGREEVLHRWPDGRSEVVALEDARSDAYTPFELSEQR